MERGRRGGLEVGEIFASIQIFSLYLFSGNCRVGFKIEALGNQCVIQTLDTHAQTYTHTD